MTVEKAPKKVKEKRQTPEQRQAALAYNHMMYGPTETERKLAPRKIDYGVAYLNHPKFQSLLTAFKKGTAFGFEVTAGDKAFAIATDGSHITFNGRTIFYSRPANRHEDSLVLDRLATVQFQGSDALVHLVIAVLRSFPELDGPTLTYSRRQFFLGSETLETGSPELGENILLGSFKHAKVVEKPRR